MSLVTSEQMLLDAQKGGYAVGAFNVENMEMVKGGHPGGGRDESAGDASDDAINR